ncbi:MAG: hypothetical protein IKK57_11060 [Clostridia bacterium]|nr:hypothetical protein [Clostridia bacterium]
MRTNESTLYSPSDLTAIREQMQRRWLAVAAPCVLLLAGVIVSLVFRVEAVTTICTILIGAILIFCWDLFIKPLNCYRKHLEGVLHGLTHETELPFVELSEAINLVDGVPCHAMTCRDVDGKGRPYDRLFYVDATRSLPTFEEGELLHITHHDLLVADVTRA